MTPEGALAYAGMRIAVVHHADPSETDLYEILYGGCPIGDASRSTGQIRIEEDMVRVRKDVAKVKVRGKLESVLQIEPPATPKAVADFVDASVHIGPGGFAEKQ